MKLLPSILLLAAATDLAPGGGSGSQPSATPPETPPEEKKPQGEQKPKEEKPSDILRKDWKGKSYAEIAAHHVSLCQQGKHDEAAAFHDAVVKTFRDKK